MGIVTHVAASPATVVVEPDVASTRAPASRRSRAAALLA